jgi:hypothetical protein
MAYFAAYNEYSMKSIFTILISVLTITAFAQGQSQSKAAAGGAAAKSSGNCYEEWYSVLKERGAKPISNGSQDVVITIRNGNYAECFLGKVAVMDGRVIGRPTIQKVDGSYEDWGKEVSKKYFNPDGTRTAEVATQLEINNGMTGELMLSDGDIVRLFFYQFVAEKPKANKKAPAPSSLIKN